MDSRYDLVEQDSDFELTARVIYLGRPRTVQHFLDYLEEKQLQQKFV